MKIFPTRLIALLLPLLAALPARGDAYGYSIIYPPAYNNVIYGFSTTETEYAEWAEVYVSAELVGPSGYLNTGVGDSWIKAQAAIAGPGNEAGTYTIMGYHFEFDSFTHGWIYWGTSSDSTIVNGGPPPSVSYLSPSFGSDSLAGTFYIYGANLNGQVEVYMSGALGYYGWVPASLLSNSLTAVNYPAVLADNYYVAIVINGAFIGSLAFQVRANPAFSCTPAVTRGGGAVCTVTGISPSLVSWRFTSFTGIGVTGPTGASWSGFMVEGGTVAATITGYGTVGTTIVVVPRPGWTTQPAMPVQVPNGTIDQLNVPPLTAADTGVFLEGLQYFYTPFQVAGGPNNGFVFVIGASPLVLTARYQINPDLEDSNSTFSQAQCGRNGIITWNDLLTQTRRHEYNSATQSHWAFYVNAWAAAANNLGDYLEALLLPPPNNTGNLVDAANAGLQSRQTAISTATGVQPYGINESEAGVFLGNVNFLPYATCN